MTTDPRIAHFAVPSEADHAATWARRFDDADVVAGVLRVDTRNPGPDMYNRLAGALAGHLDEPENHAYTDGSAAPTRRGCPPRHAVTVRIVRGDTRRLPLADNTVDLIVTSPPYAARSHPRGITSRTG
jgi:hypothetical protein